MKDLKYLYEFENLLESANNPLVQQACAEGKHALAYTCYHMPEVLLNTGDCFSVRLRAPLTGSLDISSYYMSNFICDYCKSLLERGIEGGYNFLSALLATETCSEMNRALEHFELLHLVDNEQFFVTFLDMPFKVTDNTVRHYVDQLRRKVLEPLHEVYGVDVSDDAMRKAVAEHNEVCRILTEIGQLRKEENPRITGYEYHILNLVSYCCPKYLIVDKLRETLEELRHREPDAKPNFRVKIAVVGSEIDDPGFTKLVEEAGALVVVDRFCFGSTPGREEIHLDPDLPVLESIARHYLTTSQCPRYMQREKVEAAGGSCATCARSTTRRACCTNSSSSASTGAMSARWRATSSRTTTASRPSRWTGRTPPAATASCARACRHSSRAWRSSSSRRREEASDHG